MESLEYQAEEHGGVLTALGNLARGVINRSFEPGGGDCILESPEDGEVELDGEGPAAG